MARRKTNRGVNLGAQHGGIICPILTRAMSGRRPNSLVEKVEVRETHLSRDGFYRHGRVHQKMQGTFRPTLADIALSGNPKLSLKQAGQMIV